MPAISFIPNTRAAIEAFICSYRKAPSVPYDVLLKVYRETVSAYLSSEEIRPPEDFIENLLSRFDGCRRSGRAPDRKVAHAGIAPAASDRERVLHRDVARVRKCSCASADALEPVPESCDPGEASLRSRRRPAGVVSVETRRSSLRSQDRRRACGGQGSRSRMSRRPTRRPCSTGLSNPIWLDPEIGRGDCARRGGPSCRGRSRDGFSSFVWRWGRETAFAGRRRNGATVRFPRMRSLAAGLVAGGCGDPGRVVAIRRTVEGVRRGKRPTTARRGRSTVQHDGTRCRR